MAAKIPAFQDIGKTAKELLYGGKDGFFQYNQQLSITTKTADGVEFVLNAVNAEGKGIAQLLKATYKAKRYTLSSSFASTGKIASSLTFNDIAPGLNAGISAVLPDTNSAKLNVDYSIPYFTLKALVGLNSAPKVDIAATTGHEGIVAGVDGTYDSVKGQLTRWSVGAGYSGLDYQVGLHLTDFGETVRALYAHNVKPTDSIAAEIVHPLNKDGTSFTLGYQKTLDSGALAKFKLDNTGLASILYEHQLQPATKVAITTMFDATNLEKPAKFGFALDLKP